MMTHQTKAAMTTLNLALRLPASGREQDWEIELADPERADEFAAYLEEHTFDADERFALMALTLGSLEDLAQRGRVSVELSDKIIRLLRADRALYAGLIETWSSKHDALDGFAISPLLQPLVRG